MYVKVNTNKLTIDDKINFIINNTQKLDINKDNIIKKIIKKETNNTKKRKTLIVPKKEQNMKY